MPHKKKEYRDREPNEAEKLKINRTLHQYLHREDQLRAVVVKEKKAIVSGVTQLLREIIPNTAEVYYCGSAYEDLATNVNHDYDVMFDVAPKGSYFEKQETEPGVVKLKYLSGASANYRKKYVSDDGYLSRQKVMDKQVKSSIDKLLSKSDNVLEVNGQEVEVHRSQHGPAVTLRLSTDKYKFSMDVVVTVGGCRVDQEDKQVDYVAKAPEKHNTSYTETWSVSYSRKEREALTGCDQVEVHRDVLRAIKHMRGNHPTLQTLASYDYKNIMLNMMKRESEAARTGSVVREWTQDQIADRLRDFIIELYFSLDKHQIPVRFNDDINLLSRLRRRDTAALKWCMMANIGGGGAGMMKMLSYSKVSWA